MSFRSPAQQQDAYVHPFKAESGDSNDNSSQPPDGDEKRPVKHRRNYQACEPCRERKVKCDLGDVDNPSKGPCKKCARESKDCYFRETRKKEGNGTKDGPPAVKRARTDSGDHISRPVNALSSPQPSHNFAYQTNPLSPTRAFAPATPPTPYNDQHSLGAYSQPRSVPTDYTRPNAGLSAAQNGLPSYGQMNIPSRTVIGDDHVIMPQANSLAESFTNTTDNMNVLLRAASTTEAAANDSAQRKRALTGNAGDVDMRALPAPVRKIRQEAIELWSQVTFVKAGWFTADEGLQYIEYFYTHLAPMSPAVIHNFQDPSTHRQLLTEEPVLTLAILAITSRYYEFKSPSRVSRGYYVHEKLWDSLRKIVQRLLWGQEQFGGGFSGAGTVTIYQSATGQLTWKGSLRTLGTIEALLLLTDWQPRALHFPPGDDENKLVGASTSLLEDENTRTTESGNLPYATWLEPAWRSDRMSWMLLGIAQSLAFELGVFDRNHDICNGGHGPKSDCMKRRRIRRMVITYVSQVSGRIGIQSSLSPEQDIDHRGPIGKESVDVMQELWFEIAYLMFDANKEIFPSREKTAALIDDGEYKLLVAKYRPRLQKWITKFKKVENQLAPAMRAVLRMEYEYSRLYVNSLGLQKVVGHIALQDRTISRGGLQAQLGPVYDENKGFIEETRDAARQILETSCYSLGDLKALGYSPVRTFLRTLSGLMFSLKLLSLGNEERSVRATFRLLKEMTKRMSEQVVDDVHLSPHTARLIDQLMEDVHGSMVRISKPGSRGQSRAITPHPQHNVTYSTVSDQESPDPLGQIPFADYNSQTFMPPLGFENFDGMNYDTNIDSTMFSSNDDWIGIPIDNLLDLDVNAGAVNQGYGGIGPTVGNRDMLSLMTGSHLDQNRSSGGYEGYGLNSGF